MGHTLMSEQIAQSIGWTSNGFQQELGWVSLGIGIAGLLCFWIRDRFWWATAIPFSTFLLGAAGIHLVEIMEKGNLNPGNTWIILPDLLMPLTVLSFCCSISEARRNAPRRQGSCLPSCLPPLLARQAAARCAAQDFTKVAGG